LADGEPFAIDVKGEQDRPGLPAVPLYSSGVAIPDVFASERHALRRLRGLKLLLTISKWLPSKSPMLAA